MVDASGSPRLSGTSGGVAASVDGQGLQPRPPNHPADPSMLRIQRKRVRLIGSGGRRRGTASVEEKKPARLSQRHRPQPQAEVVGSSGSHSKESAGMLASASNSVTTVISESDSGYRTSHHLGEESSSEDMLHGGRLNDSSRVASAQIASEGEMEEDGKREEEEEEEEEEGETSGYLDTSAESALTVGAGLDSSVVSSEGGVDLSTLEEDALYLYRSPPKSADRWQPSVVRKLVPYASIVVRSEM